MGRPRNQEPDPAVLEREAEVIRLRRTGATWDKIAKTTGFADASGARNAYLRAMNRIVHDDVLEERKLQMDRLDELLETYYPPALMGAVKAGEFVLKIMDRRAKLLGLDMPVRTQVEVTVWDGDTDLDREIQDLIRAMGPAPDRSGDGGTEGGEAGDRGGGGVLAEEPGTT